MISLPTPLNITLYHFSITPTNQQTLFIDIIHMDQLKFRESSIKKRHERDETSQKKYGFKYYDYCDMVPNRHRLGDSALAHSVCERRVKPLNLQRSFVGDLKGMKSMSQHYGGGSKMSNKSKKAQDNSLSQQLSTYQIACKNLRKENTMMKAEEENLKKTRVSKKKKAKSNKQNIDSSRYQELLKQLTSIQNKLNKPEYSSKNTFKIFYLDFVRSLSELGIPPPKNHHAALNQWRKIISLVSSHSI